MNIKETAQLLAYISAFDNRNFDHLIAGAWNELLREYDLEECKAAVREHFTESSKWMMPADLIGRIKEIRRERLKAIGTVPKVNAVDSTRRDAHQLLKHIAKELASGRMSKQDYEHYLEMNLPYEQSRKEIEA